MFTYPVLTSRFRAHRNDKYRQISNISRTKTHNLNVPRPVLRLCLSNPLKPGVLSWKAMLQLHLSDQELYCLLMCHLYYSFDGTLFTMLYVTILCVIGKLLHHNSIHTALFIEKFHNISNVFKSATLRNTHKLRIALCQGIDSHGIAYDLVLSK